ncbi:MAG: hypothetical protein KUG77_06650 [Nannocystaceae bacterium]|nr:hypothetical protein [Nannocystaceae bacterium]
MRLRLPLLLLIAVAPGCLDSGNSELITIFATHHASPEDNGFPFRGDDLQPRVFDLDDGWELTLAESYVTIASTTLISCSGRKHQLRMFWGPCPEDLRRADLEALTVAGLKVPPGDYCELEVQYSPYETPLIEDDAETRHVVPSLEAVEGDSVFLRGIARHADGESVPFQLENSEEFTVRLDLSELEGPGNPLTISRGQDFPTEVTVTKTYDRFFDQVDWENFDEQLLEDSIDEVLADQTRVTEGLTIPPDLYD